MSRRDPSDIEPGNPDREASERWRRMDDLLQRIFELPEDQWSEFLDRHCPTGSDLRSEVESMLRSDRAGHESFLDPLDLSSVLAESAPVDLRIGTYRLIAPLDHGGMSEIFLACSAGRATPPDGSDDGGRVVIKTLPTLPGSGRRLERFEREQDILRRLQHPLIVPILDAGTTELGQPYFVLEYIAGEHIDTHCRQQDLSLRARIELMIRVCEAVFFAHGHSVVHRDLKPSNILVNSAGEPRLLDFGISKLLTEAESTSSLTSTGRRLMTPEYASPEQLRQETVTFSSDIYSLGTVLYLLVTDRRPFEHTGSFIELAQRVCEQPPPLPSRTLIEATTPERASELDLVVLTALAKQPDARYSSCRELAEDLRRWLEDLPVSARTDTGEAPPTPETKWRWRRIFGR